MAPTIDKVVQEFDVELTKVDADLMQNEELLNRYDVMSIPTMVLLNEGKMIARVVGEQSEAALREWLSGHLEELNS